MSVIHGRNRRLFFFTGVYASLALLVVVFLAPLVWVLGLSLKSREQIFTSPPMLAWMPTLENYVKVIGHTTFLDSFWNSLAVSAGSVALALVTGVPAAYTFARFRFRGRSLIFFTLLVMRMLPPIAALVPMYVMFSKLGLANTHMSLILSYTTFSLPMIVWILRDYFADLPQELEEAAYIDGASRMTTFVKIVLPLAKPGIVTAAILSLLLAWNDFIFAAILTNNETRTSPVLLSSFAGAETGTEWGAIAASSVLVALPVIIFSLIVQKHLVSGLSSGTVK